MAQATMKGGYQLIIQVQRLIDCLFLSIYIFKVISSSDLNTQRQPQSRHFGHQLIHFSPINPPLHTHRPFSLLLMIRGRVLIQLVWELMCYKQRTHKSHLRYLERVFWSIPAGFLMSARQNWWPTPLWYDLSAHAERKLDKERQEVHADCLKPEWLIWARGR